MVPEWNRRVADHFDVFRFTRNNGLATYTFAVSAFLLGPAWAILASILLRRHGKDALWVLIGRPFALYCIGLLLLIMLACVTGQGCL
jgi:hypothetical protein